MKVEAVAVEKNGIKQWKVELPGSVMGKRTRIFGATKESAEAKARGKIGERGAFGDELQTVSVQERALLHRWRQTLPIDRMEAALSAASAERSVLVKDAVSRYRALHVSESDSHKADLKTRLGDFERQFESRILDTVTTGELMLYVKGKGASAVNFFKVLNAFYNTAFIMEWCSKNPMQRIEKPAAQPRDKVLIDVETMRSLLRFAAGKGQFERDDALLLMLVLGGFCGLRHAECLRAQWPQLDLRAKELYVKQIKTQKRGLRERFVRLPPVAVEWLKWIGTKKEGRIIELNDKNLRIHRAALLKAASVPEWPHNGLRRSCASYHLAAFEDGARTAALLGHTDAETTHAKYRLPRRKIDGKRWNALTPEKVLG